MLGTVPPGWNKDRRRKLKEERERKGGRGKEGERRGGKEKASKGAPLLSQIIL